MDITAASAAPYASLIEALDKVNAQPLWDRYMRVTSRQPHSRAQPAHWAWSDMVSLVARAVDEVSMQDAERRVLLLTHPAFAPAVATTTNLSAGLQTLLPGEHAAAHRHSLQAIRFVMQGHGAVTTVNDTQCPMEVGDLILTPAWTWHTHTHHGSERMVWFDGLDLPLCTHLDSVFLEMRGSNADNCAPVNSAPAAHHPQSAVLGPDANALGQLQSSGYTYSSARARHALQAAIAQADGSRLLRYTHANGGAVLPSLDCYLQSLPASATQSQRCTGNAVCLVVSGSGSSSIGECHIHWKQHDVFTLPHWQWFSHQASSPDTVIFMMTDYELMASLGYWRQEYR